MRASKKKSIKLSRIIAVLSLQLQKKKDPAVIVQLLAKGENVKLR